MNASLGVERCRSSKPRVGFFFLREGEEEASARFSVCCLSVKGRTGRVDPIERFKTLCLWTTTGSVPPHDATTPATMPDYKQMLKEAEDREAGVKKVFQQYDVDGGGSIDPAEITCVMEDLGLLNGLKTDVTAFVASAFARYDENDDGALSFEVRPPDSPASLCPAHRQRRAATGRARSLCSPWLRRSSRSSTMRQRTTRRAASRLPRPQRRVETARVWTAARMMHGRGSRRRRRARRRRRQRRSARRLQRG